MKLRSSERAHFTIEMANDVADADDIEIFIDGVPTAQLIGADPLPGDWGIDVSAYNRKEAGEEPVDGGLADEALEEPEGDEETEDADPDAAGEVEDEAMPEEDFEDDASPKAGMTEED